MKLSYVGDRNGDLSISILSSNPPSILVSIDTQIPQIPQFSIRTPYDPDVNLNTKEIAYLATEVVLNELMTTLVGYGVNSAVCKKLFSNIVKALSEFMEDQESGDIERSGTADEVLQKIVDQETDTLYEFGFEVPEEFFQEAYNKIVTASSSNTIVRTDRAKPYKRQYQMDFTNSKLLTKMDPTKVLRQYRNNVFKHTPSKNYIMVYDVSGKPTGVMEAPRSPIKWKR